MTEEIRLECLLLAAGTASNGRIVETAGQYLDFVMNRGPVLGKMTGGIQGGWQQNADKSASNY